VNSQGAQRCVVEVEDDGNVIKVALHDLTQPELQRAAKLAFPNIPANVWIRFDSAFTQGLIRSGDEAAAKTAVEARIAAKKAEKDGTPAPAPTPDVPAPVERHPDFVVVETGGTQGNGGESKSKAEQLADLLGDLAKPADIEALKAELQATADAQQAALADLVTEAKAAIQQAADEVRITRIAVVLPDGERQLPKLHHFQLPKLVAAVASGRNVFLVGEAGTGKSFAGEQVSEVLSTPFESISFGPTTPTSKLFGFNDANGNFQGTGLHRTYEGGGIFLGDEMDNGHPGLLAEQNQFLSNGYCAFANGMVRKNTGFRYIATGNTYGKGGNRLFVGRNQLDAATLDRFFFMEWLVDEAIEEHAALALSTNESAPAVREWLALVRRVRAQVSDLKLQMVVSPRSSIDGAALITTGAFTRDEIIDGCLLKGAGESITSKLTIK
jgi:hypothetical protein